MRSDWKEMVFTVYHVTKSLDSMFEDCHFACLILYYIWILYLLFSLDLFDVEASSHMYAFYLSITIHHIRQVLANTICNKLPSLLLISGLHDLSQYQYACLWRVHPYSLLINRLHLLITDGKYS
ncbi:hypothetical protein ACH5RR_015944 [Cinchona calisaya]|uniref:Uncharacterized protein n=1 Tax=Cinchona calisaya TaxID=153742 RepID=A0ABD2ZXZ5_9GENT